jgi:cyclic pyranopterin phosphate synthase
MNSHIDPQGGVHMVDVGAKPATRRTATACGRLRITEQQVEWLIQSKVAKGDWRTTAQIAGVQAAKRCGELIPLCHVIVLDHVEVEIELKPTKCMIHVTCHVAASAKTGVEMEALVGVSTTLLAIYDMIKGIDKAAEIDAIYLEHKAGGKTGAWQRRKLTVPDQTKK